MLTAVSLRNPVVFAYICINIDFTIFLSKNKWNNRLSHTWKHKNRHIIYVSSVWSCKITRKYVYFYIRWRPSWISPFWTFFWLIKKCNPFFSWSAWYFGSESSAKSILTDKMHGSVICDIWAYTKGSVHVNSNKIWEAPRTSSQIFFKFLQVIPKLFRWTNVKFEFYCPNSFRDMVILACLVLVDLTQNIVNVNSGAMFTVGYLGK